MMEDAITSLQNYKSNFEKIEGWCSARLFDVFSDIVREIGEPDRGVAEIGVHHGKFFMLLNSLTTGKSPSYAIDIFEQQSLNIDYSGSGNLKKFQNNLKKFDRHKGANVKIISGDSTDTSLNLRDVIGLGTLSFMSVDGGHTAEHTISDLVLAQDLISNSGLVILDDVLNAHWLGVIEGACIYLQSYPCLVPVAIGDNKLFLAKLSFRNFYLEVFRRMSLVTKEVEFFGHRLIAL